MHIASRHKLVQCLCATQRTFTAHDHRLRAHCRGRFHLHYQVKIAASGTRKYENSLVFGFFYEIDIRNKKTVSVLWSIIFSP